ncbi:MAG: lactate permease LctP family transporter [Desulfobaccales bacterium]
MPWIQNYIPLGHLGLSALVAAVPILILGYMLAVMRTKGHPAAFLSTLVAVLLAILVWRMPVSLAVMATLDGMLFGLFPVVWIVITAIWIYNMSVESGEFEIIKNSLACITDDRRLQALFIAFAFGAFLEGTAGFGTPVAITAAMLVGLGFQPVYAAGVCLIANTAPVAFGAIGIPIVVAAGVTHLPLMSISAMVGRQLPFVAVIVPLWLVVTMSGWKSALEVLPAIIVTGLCFAVSQFVVSNFVGPYLPDIVAAIVTIIGLGIFLKFWQPPAVWRFSGVAPTQKVTCLYSSKEVVRCWVPYIILAIMVILWGLGPIKAILAPIGFTFQWPLLHNLVIKAAPIAAKNTPIPAVFNVNIGSAAGTAIFIAGLLSVLFLPNYGFGKAFACLGRTINTLKWAIVTISLVLGLGWIMNYSGMSSTLALAAAATGVLFPIFSPILGWLGVFLTGSDTASNALFAGLQKSTAEQIGVSPILMVASNSSGGVVGKMISPQSIAVATAATGMVGEEGSIFRFALKHSVSMVLIISVITLLQAYVLKFMVP